jgi:hypothetical protein
MRETSASTTIHRPADEVFAYLRVYDNQAAWEDFVLEARSEPPGPAVVGTRVHKLRRTPLAEERFTLEIVAMDEAARRWTDVARDGDLAGTRVEWAVTPTADGCRLDVRVELHAHGLHHSPTLAIDVHGSAGSQGRAALQQLDRDQIGRAHERHAAVARRSADR